VHHWVVVEGKTVRGGEWHVSVGTGDYSARSALGGALRLVCLHVFDLGFEGSRLTRVVKCARVKMGLISSGWVGSLSGPFYYTTGDWRELFGVSEVFSKNGGSSLREAKAV